MQNSTHNVISRASLLLALTLGLAACGGGSNGVVSTGSSSSFSSTTDTISGGRTGSTISGGRTGSTISGGSGITSTATGSISVSWTAPAARADGSPLSLADINGYRIYYGSSRGNYPHRVILDDGTATNASVDNVPVGTYYLVMTTYDSAGRESGRSREVTKRVL